ncbi:hypothetical protein F4678DRAFT_425590 [Xylaria arbuscula]|nr:hypothetical protein F4678DRAFT_425590 [Xylaria arbuscula]
MDDSDYLPRVWLKFRLVSREFKAITELVFVRKYLPDTRIYFPTIHDVVYDNDDRKQYSGLNLQFEKLIGENDERVIFSESREDRRYSTKILRAQYLPENERTLYGYNTVLWKRDFYRYSLPPPKTAFSTPRHKLDVGGLINDTALPGLEVDWEEHAISFLWKEMLNAFFGEEDYMRRLEANGSGEFFENGELKDDKLRSLAERARAGDTEALEEYLTGSLALVARSERNRQQVVREERFRKWYAKNADSEQDMDTDNDDEEDEDTDEK